jgi:hypothetical protein
MKLKTSVQPNVLALTNSMRQLNELFREVEGSGKQLVIRSVVSISVTDNG